MNRQIHRPRLGRHTTGNTECSSQKERVLYERRDQKQRVPTQQFVRAGGLLVEDLRFSLTAEAW
jgi:hypothetical protein